MQGNQAKKNPQLFKFQMNFWQNIPFPVVLSPSQEFFPPSVVPSSTEVYCVLFTVGTVNNKQ